MTLKQLKNAVLSGTLYGIAALGGLVLAALLVTGVGQLKAYVNQQYDNQPASTFQLEYLAGLVDEQPKLQDYVCELGEDGLISQGDYDLIRHKFSELRKESAVNDLLGPCKGE